MKSLGMLVMVGDKVTGLVLASRYARAEIDKKRSKMQPNWWLKCSKSGAGEWTNSAGIMIGLVKSVLEFFKLVIGLGGVILSWRWAKDAWEWAEVEGLMDGTRPKDNITREEFSIVLKRLKGECKNVKLD